MPARPADLEPSAARGPRASVALFAALGLVAAAYANALHGPFLWDDRPLILDAAANGTLGGGLLQPFWSWSPGQVGDAGYFRPLVTLSFGLDWARGGGGAGAFHLTNLAIHLAACALVFALSRRAGAGPTAAALAAAAFGLFPRLTESVTWISGRTDLLATALGLGALLLHGTGAAGLGRRLGAAALLLLGLLSKEVAAGALAGLVAVEAAAARRGEKPWRRAALDLAPAVVAAGLYAALRLRALAHVPRDPAGLLPHGLGGSLRALGRYVAMLVDPRPASLLGDPAAAEPAYLALGLAALAALAALAVAWLRRPPPPSVAGPAAAAALALGLVLHLVHLPVFALVADRFLYLPAAGLAVVLAGRAARLAPPWPRRAALALAPVLAAWALVTVARNEDYADEIRFWEAAVRRAPPSLGLPWNELATALDRAGQHERAAAAYREALSRNPPPAMRLVVLGNLAASLGDAGRTAEARDLLLQLVAQEPERPIHRYNLAVVDLQLLRFDEAEAGLEEVLRRHPGYAAARALLASARATRQSMADLPPERPDEAVALRARRATLWTRLGDRTVATRLWRAVLADDGATAEQVRAGAAWLVANAGREVGFDALARARRAGLAAADLASFEALLDQRFDGWRPAP